MVKLSELRTADEIHRQSMRNDPGYRRAYLLRWIPSRLSILWLRMKARKSA